MPVKRGSALNIENVNSLIKDARGAVEGPLLKRVKELEAELVRGVVKPFSKVIRVNVGDCQAMGQKPITFIRQVIAACTYPSLMEQNIFPSDVNRRSKEILETVCGSIGCYSDLPGLPIIRKHVAEFIETRDGYPCDPENLHLSNGASPAIKLILQLVSSQHERSGVLVPIPLYPLYDACISEFGMHRIGYHLNEENDWSLDIVELKKVLEEGRRHSNPRILCVVNPSNPTGQLFTYGNMKEIVQFCMDEGLLLMTDEVYQHNVYTEERNFVSFRKVLYDMKAEKDLQLVSLHSCSKGFMGECGLRGGYAELIGMDEEIHSQLHKLQAHHTLPNLVGQVVMDCFVNPPRNGDPSHQLFIAEKNGILESLKERARFVYEKLNEIDGISCREIVSSLYAFPRIHLPERAVMAAQSLNQPPDEFYCLNLLEETGICATPGSVFMQKYGTYHFRMTILPPMEDLVVLMQHLKQFHELFLEKYK